MTMLYGIDPRTGDRLQPGVEATSRTELERKLALAEAAGPVLAGTTPEERIVFLRRLADRLDAAADTLVPVALAETGLGEARLRGEVARTSGQLRLFADVVADGAFHEVIIDHANPDAVPPSPELRRCLRSLGPVLVYGASNFPFAFSVLGGDTASALASGSPVLVKAHPSHPRLSALTAELAGETVRQSGLPEGTFGVLFGDEIGLEALRDPRIKACGFTGSTSGGRYLFDVANSRPDPIPFYGELGSINPVVVTAAAVAERGSKIAADFVGSFTLGTGQFCTKPGLLFLPSGHGLTDVLAERVNGTTAGPLLNDRIAGQLAAGLAELSACGHAETMAKGVPPETGGAWASAELYRTTAAEFIAEPRFLEEHFGPAAVVVEYDDYPQLERALLAVEGSLTASVHLAEGEHDPELIRVIDILTARVGRLIFDGWPTGVAVTWSMEHGGPWPATTASGTTSVGATAIRRWLRPVCYQSAPESLLPPQLRRDNPWHLPRRVDGVLRLPEGGES